MVRYSNGAVSPFEVERWGLSRLRKATKHLGYWLDAENKNSKAT